MAISVAVSSFGVTLSVGGTALVDVRDISIAGLEKATPEVTHHLSVSGWREYVSGLRQGGEVQFDIGYSPGTSSHTALITAFNANTSSTCILVFTGASSKTYTFEGILKKFEPSAPVDGSLTATIAIQVTGVITIT